jgi:hypothetical protein
MTIRKQADSAKTDPKLTDIILAGMRSYFSDTDFPIHEFQALQPQFHQLICSQEAIGWDHLVRGCFLRQWAVLQQDYYYRVYPNSKFDPAKWHHKLVNPMLINCHNLWTLCNDERHGKEKILAQLERDLIEIYKYKSEVLALDRDIFSTPIPQLLTLPPSEITKWIVSRCPIILQSCRDTPRHSTSSVQLLPAYFHPLQRPKLLPVHCTCRRQSYPSQDSSLRQTRPLNDKPDTFFSSTGF